jgi:hypothetical protein
VIAFSNPQRPMCQACIEASRDGTITRRPCTCMNCPDGFIIPASEKKKQKPEPRALNRHERRAEAKKLKRKR